MRAIIKKFEVQGFKSFYDRTKIVFHPGITAVVGPNGTGKSNIVDAILWSMGGLRLKSLRGDRTEDVIFNGNAKKPPLNMADATMTLAGEDQELTIAHRVFRTGESEYRLNGKVVRLRDIQDELWKNSIGEREYFVIEQGAIGNFVTSKPAEKRSLIEEAAGTAYYKDKKRQAQSKLENTELNLTRLEDIIIEVGKAKNSLQRQAQAANRYRRLRERIRELTSHHYRRKLTQLEAGQKHTSALYEACVSREQEVAKRVRNEEQNISGMRRELWDQEAAIKEHQEKLYGLKSQIARLESDVDRESRRLEFFDEKKKRSESDRDELLEDILILTKELEDARARLTELEESLGNRDSEVGRAGEELQAAKEETARESQSLEELRSTYLQTLQESTETRNERARLEKEIELLSRQEERLSAQVEDHVRVLDESAGRTSDLEKAVEGHSANKEAAALKVSIFQKALAETQAGKAEVQARLNDLRTGREEIAYHLQALRKIEEKERGESGTAEVPGGLGLLADLIRTSPENAPLLDAFWRDASRAQVVVAEEFFENIPESLRGNYLLIPPQALPPIPEEVTASPEFLGFLKNRFEPDDRIKDKLFYFDNAVIVSSIKEAVRLWVRHPGVNFLTSAGDLLLSSGLMRLGQKAEGMIALAAEIRELEEKIARLDAAITPIAEDLAEKAREEALTLSGLENEKGRHSKEDKEYADKERELQFILAEREKTRTALTVLNKELESLRNEKTRLASVLHEVNDRLGSQETQTRSLGIRIDDREKTLSDKLSRSGDLERDFHEKRAGLDILQEKMNGLRQQIQGTEKRKEAAAAKTAALESDARRSEEEKAELGRTVLSLREKISLMEKEQSGAEFKLSGAEAEHQVAKKKLEEYELHLQKTRSDEAAAKDDRMKFEIRKAEIERDIVNLEEMCWQELKKTIPELRAEWEAQSHPGPTGSSEDEDIEDTEESLEEEAEESAEVLIGQEQQSTEPPKPKRPVRRQTPVSQLSDAEVDKELEEARENLNRYKAVNLMAEEEFLEQKKRFEFLTGQRQDLRDSIRSTQEAIDKIDEESKVQFLKAIDEVTTNFREIFTSLFKGGDAEVKLLEPDNPLESGVEIVAQPPGKRVQNLSLLSGGEKSLTSLAFLFALFRYKPSPFCFLDEVDAALDDVNLTRFLELLGKIKHQTQFILVTHNYKTMEVADYIYGTTMEEPNITKVYSVKFEKKDVEAVS